MCDEDEDDVLVPAEDVISSIRAKRERYKDEIDGNGEWVEPYQDIDLAHPADSLRVERMTEDTIWLAGYRGEEGEKELWLTFRATDDGKLRVFEHYSPSVGSED